MNLRDYGLVDSTPTSPPVLANPEAPPGVCPTCGGQTLFLIKIEVEQKLLKGGKGTGHYFGCAACPWASPMVIEAQGSKDGS